MTYRTCTDLEKELEKENSVEQLILASKASKLQILYALMER